MCNLTMQEKLYGNHFFMEWFLFCFFFNIILGLKILGKYNIVKIDMIMKGGINMGTVEATVSMLETMPEDARIMVYNYTQSLFTSRKPENPFIPLTTDMILSDLEESRKQISEGKGLNISDALNELGEKHGFV